MFTLHNITLKICFLAFMIFSFDSYADGNHEKENHQHGTHEECSLPKNREDIIECAIDFHPLIKRSNLEIDSSLKLKDKASQLPNPIFNSRFVKGDKNGEETSELEANLSFVIELGDKRSSRKEFAEAKKFEAKNNKEAIQSEIKFSSILNLYRLRQILEEKKLLDQAVMAFTKVTKKLTERPRLSADQTASLTLFEFALEDTKMNLSKLIVEQKKIEHFFHVSTGHSLKEIKKYLPPFKTDWPKFTSRSAESSSPAIKRLESKQKLALNQLRIEKSNGWSDLRIGPSVAIEKEGDLENKMVGFNIQIPIPLFQTNNGAKAFARSELLRAKKNIDLTRLEENHERVEQIKVYKSSVNILTKTMKQSLIESKYKKVEKLYLQGVLSSSIFLESLRQKISYLKNRNERELTAINALWTIHKLNGRIFKENI